MTILQKFIAPSRVYIRTYLRFFRYSFVKCRVGFDDVIKSSLYSLSLTKIYFIFFMRWWCSKLLPNILKIILQREKKYLLLLIYLYLGENHTSKTSMLMPQMILSNMPEIADIIFYKIPMIFKNKGFLD